MKVDLLIYNTILLIIGLILLFIVLVLGVVIIALVVNNFVMYAIIYLYINERADTNSKV